MSRENAVNITFVRFPVAFKELTIILVKRTIFGMLIFPYVGVCFRNIQWKNVIRDIFSLLLCYKTLKRHKLYFNISSAIFVYFHF